MSSVSPSWLKRQSEDVSDHLGRLLRLEENWDSYGARPIREAAARGVIALLDRLGSDVSSPEIFPVADGGLTLEWNTDTGAIEIEVEGEDRISFLAEDSAAGTEIEVEGLTQSRFFADRYQTIAHLLPRTP